ncbi:MAG TPA: hypothetical protein VMO26_29470, partial [Vicinamibacterales bacterium]|nr:hypothetical protein [Vicinamibacterales bacterium]
AMRKFHMEQNGWSDLAQHLTIDPQGGLWTGRNWNLAPASATGHNGTAGEGPILPTGRTLRPSGHGRGLPRRSEEEWSSFPSLGEQQ